MDYFCSQIVLLLIVFATCNAVNQIDQLEYEATEGACSKCTCLKAQDEAHNFHYVLSCTSKHLKHIFAGWPEEFGTNHTGSEIVVSFSSNNISQLRQLPQTDAIISFSCRNCEISEIVSAAFVDTINILRLDLSWNKLNGDVILPDVFRGRYSDKEYEPIGLQDLDLSHNNITTLDRRVFEHVPHLKRLHLSSNLFDIIDLPTSLAIASAVQLVHLDLSYNELSVLPDEVLKPLTQLRELLLQGNRFQTVPESISLVGSSLRSLYIGENSIHSLNDESFLGLKKLTHLNISAMATLKELGVGTFAHLTSLEVLVCNNNPKLRVFDLGGLATSINLRSLYISKNALKELNVDFITAATNTTNFNKTFDWPKLRTLHLDSNPWHCDCLLIKALNNLERYESSQFYSDDLARCATPYDLSGCLLHSLNKDFLCQTPVPPRQPRAPVSEPPYFIRPKSIALSVISVASLIAIGLLVGFGIVFIKRRLRKDDFSFTTPIRYTTVRNSTVSVE